MSKPYALILAGGSGTRFWPLSRNAAPKQLLKLFDEETLIEKTVMRLEGLMPLENILILTNVEQEAAVRKALPQLPADNIFAEPAKRDTAPAIALGIGLVAARDPEATMIVLPADHLIQDAAAFRDLLAASAAAAANTEALVTIGIKPTWACPSYGYIERGAPAAIEGIPAEPPVYEVECFREKPSPEVAAEFLEKGNFSWNAGMFIWSIPTVVGELQKNCPELGEFIKTLQNSPDIKATVASEFPNLTKISIDFALMEKAERVLNLEATFDWDDIGSWISVAKYLDQDEAGNSTSLEVSKVDASGNIVYSKEGSHIALLGVEDLIVVQTGDAVLVARKDAADDIKKLVDVVPKELH